MKTKNSFLLIIALPFLFALNLYAQTLPSVAAPGAAPPPLSQDKTVSTLTARKPYLEGKVVSVNGEVKIKSGKSESWQNVKANERIVVGDQIKTEKSGKVKIVIENGNIVYLKPNSILKFEELARIETSGKYTNIFSVDRGKIRVEVVAMQDLARFEVRTPTSVAGVRGTVLYLDVTPEATQLFVQDGGGFLANTISGKEQEVQPGLISSSDSTGTISEPKPPDLKQQIEIQGNWEPVLMPGLLEPTNAEVQGQQQNQEDNFNKSLDDKKVSDPVDKPEYHDNPVVTNADDFDQDGIPDDEDTDDDNDGLLDAHEIQQGSNPQDPDSDDDGAYHFPIDPAKAAIDDFYDAFPLQSNASSDPTVFGSRTDMRDNRDDIIRDYDVDPYVRQEVLDLVSETRERERDAIIDKITDAQLHKVMTDVNGYRVRVEQYIFRPTDYKLICLNLCLRTDGGSTLKGVSALELKMEFAQPISSLSYQQIKDVMDWDKYFGYGSPIPYGSTPAYYPVKAEVIFDNPQLYCLRVTRVYNPISGSPPNVIQAYSNYLSINDGGNIAFDTGQDSSGNPCQFYFKDVSETRLVTNKVYEINENGQLTSATLTIDDIFDDLLFLGDYNTVGKYYEIKIWTTSPTPPVSDPPDIDIVYVPPGDVPDYP